MPDAIAPQTDARSSMMTLSDAATLRDELQRLWLARFQHGGVMHGQDMADVLMRLAGARRPAQPRLLVLDVDSCRPWRGFVLQVRRLAPQLPVLALTQGLAGPTPPAAGLQVYPVSELPQRFDAWLQRLQCVAGDAAGGGELR